MLLRVNRLQRLGILAAVLLPGLASASLLQSTHFHLDPNVANTFGGAGGSTSYKLTDSGGEAAVGAGSSQSYKLTQGYIAQLTHSIQLSVLPSGTYAYWPLDTGTGTRAYDVSPTNDAGTLVAAPAWVTGKIGNAVTLDGSSQYISTSTTQINPSTYTIELWFKTTTTSGGRLMGFGDAQTGASTNLDRQIYMTNAGTLVYGVNPGTKKTVVSSSAYNDGAWHHAAATLGTSGMTLVVDGLRVGTDASTTTAGSYTGYWRMGYDNLTGWASAPTSNFFAGSIDEVRVYNRQLSDVEIKNDYTAGNSGLRFAHTLPDITPGTSQTYSADAIVQTDAGGYDLYIQSPSLLTHTDGTTTIPAIGGSINSPVAWTEGTTKGLGFTVTSGTSVEAKWGSGPYNYAALPSIATVYHSRVGQNGGVPEKTTIQYRADTAPSQKQGTYSTTVIYTVTLKP